MSDKRGARSLLKAWRGCRIVVLRACGEFSRRLSLLKARTVSLCVAILLAGGLTGTFAYYTYITNEATNRLTASNVRLQVLENGTPSSAGIRNVQLGENGKQVALQAPNQTDACPSVVRVSFYPMVAVNGVQDFVNQGWDSTYANGPVNNQMRLGRLLLHFAERWADDWIYKDGSFIYRHVLSRGEHTPVLLRGVTRVDPSWADGTEARLQTFAEAIQATPDEPPALWGVRVSNDSVGLAS